jgi:hypothetical protein
MKPLAMPPIGRAHEIISEAHSENSATRSMSQRRINAARLVEQMFKNLPPQDIGDAETFLTSAVTLFERYAPDVAETAVFEIVTKTPRPTLDVMKTVLDELTSRSIERESRNDKKMRALPHIAPRAKRTPEEQARVDAQVAELRSAFGIKTSDSTVSKTG